MIVRIHHGIGNQMFQYAYARAASLRRRTPFKLDLGWFELQGHHRDYGLDRFNIMEDIATRQEVAHALCKDRAPATRRILLACNKLRPRRLRNFVQEDLSRLDDELLRVGKNTYVYGYFGSAEFFKDAEEAIRRDFTLKAPLDDRNADLIRRLEDCNSVCLSARRGDFVNHPLYDVCGPDYFQRAADWMAGRVEAPHFFVWSDDNTWARDNLALRQPHTFVDHNYPNFYEDLRLMTRCKHYIIPNSTFSWWGAWLSGNREALVVAPARWLNLEALKLPRYAEFLHDWCSTGTIDLAHSLPAHWVRLAN
jgi:hypothetical protein